MTGVKRMRNVGFSLIELLVVVALIGILATTLFPSAVHWRQRQELERAAREFVLAHALARASAVRLGRVTEFHVDPVSVRFWIEVDTNATAPRDTVGVVRNLANRRVSVTSNRTLLCFDGRGLPTTRTTSAGMACQAGDATVRFGVPGRVKEITFTPLGRVDR